MNQVVAMAARGGDRVDAQLEDSLYHALFGRQEQDSACCVHVHQSLSSISSLESPADILGHELGKLRDVSGGRILARFCLHFGKGVFVAVGMYLGERFLN